MAITNASLTPIYNRLHDVDGYHPMTVDSFADWAVEAGDIVTVSRGEESYASPVHTARMVWKGAPQITLDSTGSKEREAVARVSRRKYGRSGAGMKNTQELHYAVYDPDGYVRTTIDVTASNIRTEVADTISGMAQSVIEQTATYIRTEVANAASAISASVIEQTAEYVRTEVAAVASGVAWSVVEQTMTSIMQEVGRKSTTYVQWDDPNDGTRTIYDGDIWIKSYDNRTWNALSSKTWNELSAMKWNTFYSDWVFVWKNGKWNKKLSTDAIVESNVRIDQDDEKWRVLARQVSLLGEEYRGNLTVTAQKISSDVSQTNAELNSKIEQTSRSITTQVNAAKGELNSTIRQTATNIVMGVYDYVSDNYSTIEQTASSISIAVGAASSTLYSQILVTATGLYTNVTDYVSDNYSTITQTSTSIALAVSGASSTLTSLIMQTATGVYTNVSDYVSNNYSTILQTSTMIYQEVVDENIGNYSTIESTSTAIDLAVASSKTDWMGEINVQKGRIDLVVTGTGSNAKVNSASIVLGINNQDKTSSSYVDISADYINLTAYVKASQITADYLKTKIADIDLLTTHGITVNNNIVSSGGYVMAPYIYLGTIGNATEIHESIKDLQITSSGNTYKLQKKNYSDADWVDVGSFSRAVSSWSGNWSGNAVLSVKASPQDQSYTVGFGTSYNSHNIDLELTQDGPMTAGDSAGYLNVPLKISSLNGSGAAPTSRYTKTLTTYIDSLLQNRGTVTSNGTYTPGSGYVGIKSITVNITPLSRAKAAFFPQVQSGYYFAAYDGNSQQPSQSIVSGSQVYYQLALSGTKASAKVQIQTTSGTKYSNTPELSVGSLYVTGQNDMKSDVQASWVKPDIYGSAPLHSGDWFNTRIYKSGTEIARIQTDGSSRGVKLHAMTEITENNTYFPDSASGYMGFYGLNVNVYPNQVTMTRAAHAKRDDVGTYSDFGTLYYYDAHLNQYKAASNVEGYWYFYTSPNRTLGSTRTFHY